MHRFLVACDGSEASLRAIDYAAGLASALGAVELVLVNVQPEPEFRVLALHRDEIFTDLTAAGQEILDQATTRLRAAGLEARTLIKFGPPAEEIERAAREVGADTIVMGTRGLGGVAGVLLGSVSQDLLHLAEVPVTLIK